MATFFNKQEKIFMYFKNRFFRFRFFLPAVVLALTLFISGCSKDDSNDNNPVDPGGDTNTGTSTITLNGGTFNNTTLTLKTYKAVYDPTDNTTSVGLTGMTGSDSVYVYVTFNGQQTGTQAWGNLSGSNSDLIILIGRLSQSENLRELWSTNVDSGSTNVTLYGGVGKTIAGTFSGKVTDLGNQSRITVSGKFSITRDPDSGSNPGSDNSITINGGGYSNLTFNLSNAVGAYVSADTTTSLIMSGSASGDSVYVAFSFAGNSTGTYTWQNYSSGSTILVVRIGGLSATNPVLLVSDDNSGSTIVTSYGAVGSAISGTYSGKLYNLVTQQEITVTGKFSGLRVQDE